MKKINRPFTLVLLIIIANIFVLSSCNIINSSTDDSSNNPNYNPIDYPSNNSCIHDWEPPTCLEPAQCSKCDAYKTDGKLGNHAWRHATCQEPAFCYYCYEQKDNNLGTHKFLDDGYCVYCGIARD